MKKISILFICICSVFSISKAQVPSYISKDSLIGWWPFDGDFKDGSGNGFDGTNFGCSFITDRNGNNNAALGLNGSNNYINFGDSNRFNPVQNFTVSVWLRTSKTKGNMAALGKWANNTNPNGEQFILYFDWNSVSAAIRTSNNWVPGSYANYKFNYADSKWHHYLMTYNGSILSLYVDGILRATKGESGNVNNCKNDFLLGGYSLNLLTNYSNLWNGDIDDFAFWNRSLNTSEIKSIFYACPGINKEPSNLEIGVGKNAKFTVEHDDSTFGSTWQSKHVDMPWQTLVSNSTYGINSKSLVINKVSISNHRQSFRVIFDKNNCRDTSVEVSLRIADTCIIQVNDTLRFNVYDTITNVVNDTMVEVLYDTVTVQDTLQIFAKLTGSNPFETNLIKVYPNPTSDVLVIDFGNYTSMAGYEISITDAVGKSVYTSTIIKSKEQIDLNTWSGKGIYYLRIFDKSGNRIENRKIVIY